MERVQYQTPEDVDLHFRVAGPGSRFMAYLIDRAILTVFLLVLAILLIASGIALMNVSEEHSIALYALYYMFLAFTDVVYFTACELGMGGRSIGKRKLGIAVVMVGGYAVTPLASIIRNLFRLIDTVPLFWLVPLFAPQHRRLGDLAAGTQVVHTPAAKLPHLPFANQRYGELAVHELMLTRDDLQRFTARDLEVLDEFFVRRKRLPAERVQDLEHMLLQQFQRRLAREAPSSASAEALLKELYLALREHLDRQ